ncbi:MAG: ice-binding family protein [Bryobacteraceae bacterium]
MKNLCSFLLYITLCAGLQAAQLPVTLGSASTFTILAASTVTNTGPSVINGEVGVSPGTALVGFPPGSVTGGSLHAADGPASAAQGSLTSAYNDAAGRVVPAVVAGDLGGLTLAPGLYKSTSSLGITGVLRLDGQGDSNSVFIFQVASALTTASGSQVMLQGGARAANIFWQVGSSATLGTNSLFNGTIMAQASVSLLTGAALNGRALARTAAVTLDSNTIVNPGPPTVGIPPAPLTITCPLSSAQTGIAYNSVITATGGVPPYAFLITGLLPPGLSLSPITGTLSGTPTAAGTFTFVANVLDNTATSASSTCSIAISTPVIPPATPSLTCPANTAQAGVAYNSSIAATGGRPPYSFSITGSLPQGLSLNASTGAIAGSPTVAGSSIFTANVLDSTPVSSSIACTITTSAAESTGPPTPPGGGGTTPPGGGGTTPPSPVPAPSSLPLVLIGFACLALYHSRERARQFFKRS